MEVDEKPSIRRRDIEEDIVDDEDLQAVLAKQRRTKVKKVKPLDPEEIARRSMYDFLYISSKSNFSFAVLEEKEQERAQSTSRMDLDIKQEEDDSPTGDAEDGGLEFDDTSEFVRSIQYNPVEVKQEERQVSVPTVQAESKRHGSTVRAISARAESPMETDQALHELEAGEVAIKEEPEDDEEMLNALEDTINVIEANEKITGVKSEDAEVTISFSLLMIVADYFL